jgi:hypothetical protein
MNIKYKENNTAVALHSYRSAWRQVAQRSPPFQVTVSRGPSGLAESIAVTISVFTRNV